MVTQLTTYSLQSGLCMVLSFLFYRLLLRNQPCLSFNRLYLLLAPLVALALPLVELPAALVPAQLPTPALQAIQLPEIAVVAYSPDAASAEASVPYTALPFLLLLLYLLVALGLLGRLCLQLIHIRKLASGAAPLLGSSFKVKVFQAAVPPPYVCLPELHFPEPPASPYRGRAAPGAGARAGACAASSYL